MTRRKPDIKRLALRIRFIANIIARRFTFHAAIGEMKCFNQSKRPSCRAWKPQNRRLLPDTSNASCRAWRAVSKISIASKAENKAASAGLVRALRDNALIEVINALLMAGPRQPLK